jgi:hypothetical protein
MTWGILRIFAPQMPQSWPFALAEAILTVGLLLLIHAWVLLLVPSKWDYLVRRVGFGTTITALSLWWIAALCALLLTILLAATHPASVVLPLRFYA